MRKKIAIFVMTALASLGIAAAAAPSAIAAPSAPAASDQPLTAAAGRQLYDYRFLVQDGNLPLYVRPGRAFQELHRCFNCSFPVPGAPRAYPSFGQRLNLRPCAAGGFGCRNAPVVAQPYDPSNIIRLIALEGHFDGKDSQIDFEFRNINGGPVNGALELHVRAWVTHPSVPDDVNRHFAHDTWDKFAKQLGHNIRTH